jgi:hypothetical protein
MSVRQRANSLPPPEELKVVRLRVPAFHQSPRDLALVPVELVVALQQAERSYHR